MPDTLSSRPVLSTLLGWRRLVFGIGISAAVGALFGLGWQQGVMSAAIRAMTLGLMGTVVFGIFELWPRRLPSWVARWVIQVAAVAAVMPLTTTVIYLASTKAGAPPFWHVQERLTGFLTLAVIGLLLAPWVALGALVRQRDALARHQAIAFELERSQLERQALDSRLRLLRAQVAPHFLFNTLANVQALVEGGSPQAPVVLRSLVAYLRAAVPRLDDPVTTLGQEIALVQAYLDLMHMRMPDRLRSTLNIGDDTVDLRCPPLTLLTLVENAVRHGIDPSEDGGTIIIDIHREKDRCHVHVRDDGMGLGQSCGLGTGISTLRERLNLIFAGDAHLELVQGEPGVTAKLDFPAQEV